MKRDNKKFGTAQRITRCLWNATLPQIRLRRTSQTPKTLSEIRHHRNKY